MKLITGIILATLAISTTSKADKLSCELAQDSAAKGHVVLIKGELQIDKSNPGQRFENLIRQNMTINGNDGVLTLRLTAQYENASAVVPNLDVGSFFYTNESLKTEWTPYSEIAVRFEAMPKVNPYGATANHPAGGYMAYAAGQGGSLFCYLTK